MFRLEMNLTRKKNVEVCFNEFVLLVPLELKL